MDLFPYKIGHVARGFFTNYISSMYHITSSIHVTIDQFTIYTSSIDLIGDQCFVFSVIFQKCLFVVCSINDM